jgi:hypothetical protein
MTVSCCTRCILRRPVRHKLFPFWNNPFHELEINARHDYINNASFPFKKKHAKAYTLGNQAYKPKLLN